MGGERGDLRGNEEEWGEWSIIYRGEIREEWEGEGGGGRTPVSIDCS